MYVKSLCTFMARIKHLISTSEEKQWLKQCEMLWSYLSLEYHIDVEVLVLLVCCRA